MINKKLDDILENIETIKKIFNDTKYFENLEKVIDKQNKFNEKLRNEILILQSKIDKAIYWINEYCIKECEEGDIKAELRNVKDILKGEDNE